MSTPNMDPANYMSSLSAESQGDGFGASLRQTAMAAAPAHRALAAVTPSRAVLAGWGALAVAAGNTQEQLSSLAAAATVTHARMGQLTTGMNSLARSYGIGNSGARELYSQLSRLGTVSQGLEGNVNALAKGFTRLSGATGEGAGGLASGFLMLNRSMSTGFDANRMTKLGDSLTTVAAKSGASATGILAFAKNIAPMAQATGIGETKVLGISAAFTKLGDDGVGAATAFNKMLGDMNRSIRDGSPMLTTYASIVGKTTEQFTKIVKTNPAEAITQVTEALGKPGGNSPRQLEMLGLDGVRSQRYLQELAQSGGLRSAISTSVGGYGSGATNKAAEKAFGTFADSTQRAAANAQQLGEAIGAPLLGPLTRFTDAMGAAVTPLRAAAQSDIGKKFLEVGAALLLVSKVLRPMTSMMMVGGAATSGPVRSLFAGAANARGSAPGSWLYRAGGGVTPLVASGADIGRGAMIPVNSFFARMGANLNTMLTGTQPGRGPGAFAQARGLGLGGIAAWNRMTSESIRNFRLPAEERFTRITPRAGFLSGGRAAGREFDAAHQAMVANEVAQRQGLITPGEQMRANMREFARVRQTMANMSMPQQLGMAGRAALAPLGQTMLTGGSKLMGALGGPVGLGITAATTVGMLAYSGHQKAKEYQEGAATSTGFLDDYRVAMGKATQATSTFAGKMQATADELTSAITSMQEATTVDAKATRIASETGRQVTTYAGDSRSIAAGLRTQIAGGASPDEVGRMRTDLIKQYGPTKAREIMQGLGTTSGDLSSDLTGDIRTQLMGAGRAPGAGGWRTVASGLTSNRWFGGSNSTTAGVDVNTLSKAQKSTVRSAVADIETRRQQRTDAYGEGFANQGARKEIDAAVQAAMDSGNDQYLYRVENEIQGKYGVKSRRVSAGDVRKAGGFANWEAANSGKFSDTFGKAPSAADIKQQQSQLMQTLSGNMLQGVFGGVKVQNLIGPNGTPESPQAQTAAMGSIMQAAGAGNDNLQKLAESSLAAANALGDVQDAGKLALAAFNQAAQQISANAAFQTSGGSAMSQARLYASMARQTPTNDSTKALHDQGVQGLQTVQTSAVQAAQQRLAQVREYQVAMTRQADDYRRQETYADDDYKRQRQRAEQDYGTAVTRTKRNYLIQMADAEQDYQRQISIANRDFAKQQTRQAEDAAKSMYDPYQRIQAKGIWDPQALSMNMAEQAQAMQAQIANLGKLRQAGVSNATITLLGLNDPNNAQQLASAVGDLVNDPKLVATLNSQTTQRQSLASTLLGDPSNASFQRQKQDFATSMNDAASAYAISVRRAARNLHTQLGDMASDQSRSLNRSFADYTTGLNRMAQANSTMITRAGEDLARSQQQIVGNLSQLTTALAQGTGVTVATWSGIVRDGMKDWAAILKAFQTGDWPALTAALNAPFLASPATSAPAAHHDPDMPRAHAAGVIFNRPVFSGRDEAGEAGPEMVLPLNSRGSQFLADTMMRMGSPLEARAAGGAAQATVINNNQTYHYDSSVRPEHVELRADNPLEMGEALRRRAVRERSSKPAVLR